MTLFQHNYFGTLFMHIVQEEKHHYESEQFYDQGTGNSAAGTAVGIRRPKSEY